MNTLTTSLIYFLLSITLAADFSASQILFQEFNWESSKKGGWYLPVRKLFLEPLPPAFKIATSGKDYAVWEKKE
ncbi:hypothetical protein L3X38_029203 [Prunus dulcis]|uniref:Uncharacterized protein n=1 Tax=Prunus dulcis TaxID=3755 RepID=A0AAD4VTP4_PRUDU|nr:hypothetical protein L3X38_029203 [Prunus dulcis]